HQTACSCPYDYKGICKHIVASVEDLADRLDKGSLATQTVFFDVAKQVKKLETSDVKLIDGEFDLENLRKRIQKKSITYGYVNYIDLNFAHIKSKIAAWNTNQYQQEIALVKDQNKLE